MGKTMKTWLQSGLKSWPTLIIFEVLYKAFGFVILSFVMDAAKSAVLKISDLPFLSQETMVAAFTKPMSLLVVFGVFLVFAYYIYFEITALILYCEAGWQNERITVWELIKKTARHVHKLLSFQNIPVLFFPCSGNRIFSFSSHKRSIKKV
ncbi:MAG: hypothetical protein GX684_03640 [Ruminococcaceae bacterium]|nr:hypothetical protein [Oscillospiraceae bacterium]